MAFSSVSAPHFVSTIAPMSICSLSQNIQSTLVFLLLELLKVFLLYIVHSDILGRYPLISDCIPCVFFVIVLPYFG